VDVETRKIFLLLLDAFEGSQIRALTFNTTLIEIMNMTPKQRATLNLMALDARVGELRSHVKAAVRKQSASVRRALEDDQNAVSAIQVFASTHIAKEDR
jgi:hypothetical protein